MSYEKSKDKQLQYSASGDPNLKLFKYSLNIRPKFICFDHFEHPKYSK